jgi:hypothetical protein
MFLGSKTGDEAELDVVIAMANAKLSLLLSLLLSLCVSDALGTLSLARPSNS